MRVLGLKMLKNIFNLQNIKQGGSFNGGPVRYEVTSLYL